MSYQLYRQSKLGDSLVEALDQLVTEGKITPDLALKVLAEVRLSPAVPSVSLSAALLPVALLSSKGF